MRKLVYYVAVSIDGFIAGPGGESDFYPEAPDMVEHLRAEFPETMPTHIRPHIGLDGVPNKRFDTVLMGRGTYQPALDAGVSSPYAHLRQYVVSRSLPDIADPAVELVSEDPIGLVRRLKAEDGDGDIWLCGGGVLAGQLLPEIDELLFKRYPVVAGDGVPAFAGQFRPRPFAPVETLTFSHGGTLTTYRPTA
ncbi:MULTISPECIES: dihydrofolate reductase family protein [Streptomyces]|uniref:Deaminase n=2 Tax=Streptomyces TaxID=1883 RepID=A0A2N8PH11_STRNR|nr:MULTISPECIES: dihydrofolate reductase family protein [Streptomyces]PNE40266.1 deaminase [Streptomyces noursei]SHL42045.1 Dihydrofolate reductase [Streptomyces yunnanensis]